MPNEFKEVHDKDLSAIRKSFECFIPQGDYLSKINVPKPGGGDVDLVCWTANTLIVLELKASSGTNVINQFKQFLGTYKRIDHELQTQHNPLKGRKVSQKIHLFCIPRVSRKIEKKLRSELEGGHHPTVFIIRHEIDTVYSKLARTVSPQYARNEFLKDFKGHTKTKEELLVPAIRTPLGKSYMYQFTCSAKSLAEFSTVSRRTSSKDSIGDYQRMVNGTRLKSIASNFLNNKGEFVNNVIIRVEEEAVQFNSYDDHLDKIYPEYKKSKSSVQQGIEMGLLKLKMNINSAFIIDGQHRLLSYYHANQDGLIRVSALAKIEAKEEAAFFLDINDKAKPVDKNLIWDLVGVMDPNGDKGLISRIVKELHGSDESAFFQGTMNPPSGARTSKVLSLSFSGICRTLEEDLKSFHKPEWSNYQGDEKIKNPYRNKNYEVDKLASALDDFFTYITNGMSEEKLKKFFNDAVVAVYLQLAYIFFKSCTHKSLSGKESEILDYLKDYIQKMSDEEVANRRKWSNSADKKYHLETIVSNVRKEYSSFGPNIEVNSYEKRFADWEGRFREWFNQKMIVYTNDEEWVENSGLIRRDDIKRWKRQQPRWESRSLYTNMGFGTMRNIIGNQSHQKYPVWHELFEADILKLGYISFEDWSNSMDIMSDPRNPPYHGVKGLVYNKELQKRAEDALDKMTKLIES